MSLTTAKTSTFIIGLYQIVGGLFGIEIAIYNFYHYQINLFWLLYSIVGFFFFVFCLHAGIQTMRNKPQGLSLTFYNQLFQLISFSIFGFKYLLNAGLGLYLSLDMTNSFDLGWTIILPQISLGKYDYHSMQLSVNLIPILIVIIVERLKQRNLSVA